MTVLDSCHFQIARALQKAGWVVNDRPEYIYDLETDSFIFIDLQATREANGALKERQQLYVEVKCFPGHNKTQELYIALGQYVFYRAFLAKKGLSTPLYLAIPSTIYGKTFTAIVQQACRDNHLKLVLIDLETETVTQWLE